MNEPLSPGPGLDHWGGGRTWPHVSCPTLRPMLCRRPPVHRTQVHDGSTQAQAVFFFTDPQDGADVSEMEKFSRYVDGCQIYKATNPRTASIALQYMHSAMRAAARARPPPHAGRPLTALVTCSRRMRPLLTQYARQHTHILNAVGLVCTVESSRALRCGGVSSGSIVSDNGAGGGQQITDLIAHGLVDLIVSFYDPGREAEAQELAWLSQLADLHNICHCTNYRSSAAALVFMQHFGAQGPVHSTALHRSPKKGIPLGCAQAAEFLGVCADFGASLCFAFSFL